MKKEGRPTDRPTDKPTGSYTLVHVRDLDSTNELATKLYVTPYATFWLPSACTPASDALDPSCTDCVVMSACLLFSGRMDGS